jgi:hypothetical protein
MASKIDGFPFVPLALAAVPATAEPTVMAYVPGEMT